MDIAPIYPGCLLFVMLLQIDGKDKIMLFGRNLDTYDPQILADYHQMRMMVIRGTWLGNQLADYYLFAR